MDITQIKNGGVGVIATDTIYGLCASIRFPEAIKRIYHIKERDFTKKLPVLVADYNQLVLCGVTINAAQRRALETVWPGPVSAELPCLSTEHEYLHKGTHLLLVRMPAAQELNEVLKDIGPIVATSANKAGQPTPSDLEEIKQQLPDLDFYIEGPVGDTPSRLVRVHEDGTLEWLERQR